MEMTYAEKQYCLEQLKKFGGELTMRSRVEHQLPKHQTQKRLGELRVGDFGVTCTGRYFLRTPDGATCLNLAADSLPQSHVALQTIQVTLLPPGTKITIEIEE